MKEWGRGAAQEWFLPVSLSDHPKPKLSSCEYEHQAVSVSVELIFDQAFSFSVGKILC